MSLPSTRSPASPCRRPWAVLAGCLILAAAGLRIAYLAAFCPLDLAPDEAHYWDWSRHLDWSYYSKGPLIAYLIRAGCVLAGSWSRWLTGSEMLAVRLPAVLCGSLLLVSLFVLTRQVFGRDGLAAAVVALGLTLPAFSAGSTIMTIDAPYTCCWGWALVLGHHAIFRRAAWAWIACGLVVGVGVLAKYTMVLFVPSVGLFLLTSAAHRRLLRGWGFWTMAAVGALCCTPILIWNIGNDWVSWRHVSTLAGLDEPSGLQWLGPLVYLGTQCGLLLVFWFVAWLCAMIAHRPWTEPDAGVRYLWWTAAPMFAVFLGFSLKNGGGEPNWPITAYLSGLVLAVAWLDQQLRSPRRWYRWWTAVNLATACTVGVVLTLLVHRSETVWPVLAWFTGPPADRSPLPLRRLDPTCRLRGWQQTLAAEVDRLRAELRRQGVEPLLAGSNWALPGELGFYCAGHPTVYSLGLRLGDRHSQYDLWHPNPVDDASVFAGQTFILVGNHTADLQSAFAEVQPLRIVTHVEHGQPVAVWGLTVCRGFRGFPQEAAVRTKRSY
jgi:Dolichyl-phosphate-mannose-protein mannosyltransferase